MKQLLLATATLVGLSSAALAAEPVALTDSQLDNVTAGATFPGWALPGIAAIGFGPLFVVAPAPWGTAVAPLPGLPSVP